jgi:rhodanese-related sulfurtransferase
MTAIRGNHRTGQAIWQSGAIVLEAIAVGLLVDQERPAKLPLVADWSPKAQLTPDSGINLEIALEDAQALFFARIALFLDARSLEQYSEGHIQRAVNLPWDEFEKHFPQVMDGVPDNTPIVTYCDGETCDLSKDLAFALRQKGFFNVRVLVNGWTLWQQNGLPLATGAGP